MANGQVEQFGAERVIESLAGQGGWITGELLGAVNAAVAAVVGDAPQFDDLTMMCVEYKGERRMVASVSIAAAETPIGY